IEDLIGTEFESFRNPRARPDVTPRSLAAMRFSVRPAAESDVSDARGAARRRDAKGGADPRDAIKLDDALVATFFAAPLANRMLRRIESWPVSPNQVTLVSVAVTLLAALLFASPWWPARVAGAVLLQLGFVLDCLDGQLARHRGQATSFGAWLDFVGNCLQDVFLFAAIAWGVHASGGELAAFLWGYAAIAVVFFRHLDNLLQARFLGGRYVELLQGRSRAADDPLKRAVLEEARREGTGSGAGRLLDALAPKSALGGNRVLLWTKKALLFTGGERYLLISLLAVVDRLELALPAITLWGLAVYPLITLRRWTLFGGAEP
ncbi:MAG: CDP-alcohol phosphatidyltransferase family protein, partial [Candidatus Binatia bacterium]